MIRTVLTLAVGSVVLCVPGPAVQAATMPAILGSVITAGNQRPISAVELALFRDNGNGLFDGSDPLVSSTVTAEDGKYKFDALDPDAAYFVWAAGEVSELRTPFREPFFVDSFDITQSVVANPISGGRMNSVSGPSGLLLGGNRDMYLEVIDGIAEAKLRANPYSINSHLQLDLAAGVSGLAVITWDGVAGTRGMEPDAGLGGVDLTQGGLYEGVMARLAVDAAGAGQSAELRVFSGDRVSSADFAFPVVSDVTPTGFAYVPFAQFAGDADPRQVTALQLVIEAAKPSLDAKIDLLAMTGPSTVDFVFLPEPSTALLLLVSLMAMQGFLREGGLLGSWRSVAGCRHSNSSAA